MGIEGDDLLLDGPDGGNPLGFLCAVGTLRVATTVWGDRTVRMRWTRRATGWRPVLSIEPMLEEGDFVEGVHTYCRFGRLGLEGGQPEPEAAFPYFTFAKNTSKIEPERYRDLAMKAVRQASSTSDAFAAFMAAFGCDACVDDDGYVRDTAFRTMSGSGHQHFLGTMVTLVEDIEPSQIREALFEAWRYEDPLKKHSMRWAPKDEKRYALQWRDPSGDPSRGMRGSMHGANRLAIEALPLFPVVPRGVASGRPRLATTGFDRHGQGVRWTWPIWTDPITSDVCGSLLAHPDLATLDARKSDKEVGDRGPRTSLRRMGVEEVFQCRRITVGYFRNFTPARAM